MDEFDGWGGWRTLVKTRPVPDASEPGSPGLDPVFDGSHAGGSRRLDGRGKQEYYMGYMME